MKIILYFIIIFFISTAMLYAEDTCTLKVKITNFRSANNNVILLLFDDKNTSKFSDSKYSIKKIESKVKNNALVLSIPNLKYGKYAIAVLHDEDNNGEMTTGFLGLPREGYGYSNNAKVNFGPPKFENASFLLNKTDEEISIEIRYF